MAEAPGVTNVVGACGKEGRAERLDALLEGLETCEKALQDYLETKRVAFPRFYFVAPADLLDILSKGSNPQAILRCALGRACFGKARHPPSVHVNERLGSLVKGP